MNGIVNQTQDRRSRTLSPGIFVKRTAKSQMPQSRGQLGQGQRGLGQEGVPGLSPWTGEAITQGEVEQLAGIEVTEWPEAIPLVYTWPAEVRLALGDRGDQVRDLQTQLRRLGFGYSQVDGIFGALTEQAVTHFQQSVGLPGTGQVDEVTWAALQSAVPALPSGGIPTTAVAPVPTALAPTAMPAPEGLLEVPPSMRLAPSIAEAAPTELLGLPTGFWVAIGAIVLALFATATPGPAPQPRKVLRA